MADALETVLARDRAVSIAALVLLTVLAWAWLFAGAGMGMSPIVSLSPLATGNAPASGMAMTQPMTSAMAWSAGRYFLTFSMWWVMMVAMMLPSAAPTILLYARAAAAGEKGRAGPATRSFLAGYLATWGMFSLIATILQLLLDRGGLLAPMAMASGSRWL